MIAKELEKAGAIKINDDGRYVVRVDHVLEVLSLSLKKDMKVTVVGRTSSTEGAAFIVAVEPNGDANEFKDGFFVKPEGRNKLSQALLDVVERRS